MVAVFGLSQREARVLHTICLISKTRPRTYELMPTNGRLEPDMAIVDGYDEWAIAEWLKFSANRPMLPLVLIGEHPKLDHPDIRIERPLLPTQLLNVFDRIKLTDEHPAFSPQETTNIPPGMPVDEESIPAQDSQTVTFQGDPRLRALVVDDSLPIRKQMQKELSQFVGHVDLAETGEQGLEFIAKKRYDIVFLDVVLPGLDGYQICKTIKRDKENKDIPVIMLTGKASSFDQIRGKLAGCDTYLIKPADLVKFKEVVEKYLIKDGT